ncbi:cytoplasmic glycerophosphodiester phosphodiesterase [Afipia felis]|uniref:Cytoplasmic glycerophosphodiester phosphodiesterase n=1 Tax=Afipia felis TaxID=1035 RepID=A0A090N6Z6_AFIFE|nr:glycerophosphodiester phosphodiesterase family protein [Afipia felis]CEG07718.1 cytoplasmic glycerophosphodiester phosphodiesterase [Afipia felis]
MPSRAPDWLTAAPVAHRGLHDAARGIVESTPSAFSAAIAGGFAIETDLQLSSDGEAMVFHDDTLTRLTERSDDIRTLSAAELKTVRYKDTTDRMITLGDLCDMTNGRVPLVVEIKSRFDGDRRLIRRIAEIVRAYQGPLALMSFDPDQVLAIRDHVPAVPRGVVAERYYREDEWQALPPEKVRGMLHLRHAFRTRPHFIAYWINELPTPAPWIAQHIFGCALLTWTVRTPDQRARAARYADQMIFEGFVPEPKHP